jgi:DNA-binding NarL/FixJ family response regulator
MRVAIAKDNPLVRDGIALVLADHDIDVIATVSNAADLHTAVDQHRPDLAIVDVRMPPTHTDEGIRAALEIRATSPDVAVLLFSQWIELAYAWQLLASPTKVGYLLKDRVISTAGFIDAIRRVVNGGTALRPRSRTRPTRRAHDRDRHAATPHRTRAKRARAHR